MPGGTSVGLLERPKEREVAPSERGDRALGWEARRAGLRGSAERLEVAFSIGTAFKRASVTPSDEHRQRVGFENSVMCVSGGHAAALYSLMRPPRTSRLWMVIAGARTSTAGGWSGG